MYREPPPPVISGIRVLEFAFVQPPAQFTGKLRLNVGGEWLGAVPRLVIGQDLTTGELLLLHCDEQWDVKGVQGWNGPAAAPVSDVDDIKIRTEKFYSDLMPFWQKHAATLEEATAYHKQQMEELVCQFCGELPETVLFSQGSGRICAHCVERFHKELGEQ